MIKFLCALFALVITAACGGGNVPVNPPGPKPPTFCERMLAEEMISCADMTYHADELIPPPDPQRMFYYFDKARKEHARVLNDPSVLNIKMGQIAWIRPALIWQNPWPMPYLETVVDGGHPRGYATPSPYPVVFYAYEEIIEHETHHAIGMILHPEDERWLIYCHGTPDDPFGVPGKTDSCVADYRGPTNPNLP